MTSQEIRNHESSGRIETQNFWLREIAYQLAVQNENGNTNALIRTANALDKLADPQQPKRDAIGERGGLAIGWYWVWYESTWILGAWDGEDWNIVNGATVPRRNVIVGSRIPGPPKGYPSWSDRAVAEGLIDGRNDDEKEFVGDHDPPVTGVKTRHPFAQVQGNPFCGECGGGPRHSIHQQGAQPSEPAPTESSQTKKEDSGCNAFRVKPPGGQCELKFQHEGPHQYEVSPK